jgi:hypothetical protein
MKNPQNPSRRSILKIGAAGAGALAVNRLGLGNAYAQDAGEKAAVLVVFLNGGYNALHCSADSFIGTAFGVTANNVRDLGNGLVVDSVSLGALSQGSLDKMATIGVKHGISAHGTARTADFHVGTRSAPIVLANLLGGTGSIKCASVGGMVGSGNHPAEAGTSIQNITDLRTTIDSMGGGAPDPTAPKREMALAGLVGGRDMSADRLAENPNSLKSIHNGFGPAIETLKRPVQVFDYNQISAAYGVPNTTTAVTSFPTRMLAAEVMIRAGANVVIAQDGGWDTHGDTNGQRVRTMMSQRIIPPLKVFLDRMLADPNYNVVTVIMGDFSRSLPGSDHQANLSATVIGKYVQKGTTGRTDARVALANPANVPQLWSYLASAAKVNPGTDFGPNPHGLII